MLQDIRFALRTFARNPLFTLGAVATLALGIGVNSTIFSCSNAVLFRPLPGVAEPDRLAWVSTLLRDRGRATGMSYPDFVDYRDASRETFVEMVAFTPTPLSLGSGGDPERIRGHLVTGAYFELLGVAPAAGRLLAPSDDRVGAALPVVVISHRLWQRRFSGSADLGFNPRQVLTASYDLALQNYPDARRESFRRELLARVRALPGVTSATTDDRGQPIERRAALNAVGPARPSRRRDDGCRIRSSCDSSRVRARSATVRDAHAE